MARMKTDEQPQSDTMAKQDIRLTIWVTGIGQGSPAAKRKQWEVNPAVFT
ncbi:MAG: hypothetical protein ACP5D9_09450 [Mariniphaga sp.]